MKILKYSHIVTLFLVSFLTLLLLLPARLSLNLFYEAYIEYIIYINFFIIVYLILNKKINFLLKFLPFVIAIFFHVKYIPIFFNFYNKNNSYKDESNKSGEIEQRIKFLNHTCSGYNLNNKKQNLVFTFSDQAIKIKNTENIKISKKDKIYIEKNIFLKGFDLGTKKKINIYFFDFKKIDAKKLISRRIASYLRHRERSIIYVKNLNSPFSLIYRSFVKTSNFYNALEGRGYPFFSGGNFTNHILISKDITANVVNFDLNCYSSLDLHV